MQKLLCTLPIVHVDDNVVEGRVEEGWRGAGGWEERPLERQSEGVMGEALTAYP